MSLYIQNFLKGKKETPYMWSKFIITPAVFTSLVKMEQTFVVIKADNFHSP